MVNSSAGTGPVLVRQVTFAVSFNRVITQDMVVSEPSFTSLFTDLTSEVSFDKTKRNLAMRWILIL